jgi:hypothetical protein
MASPFDLLLLPASSRAGVQPRSVLARFVPMGFARSTGSGQTLEGRTKAFVRPRAIPLTIAWQVRLLGCTVLFRLVPGYKVP